MVIKRAEILSVSIAAVLTLGSTGSAREKFVNYFWKSEFRDAIAASPYSNIVTNGYVPLRVGDKLYLLNSYYQMVGGAVCKKEAIWPDQAQPDTPRNPVYENTDCTSRPWP